MLTNTSPNKYYTSKGTHQKLKIHSNLEADNCTHNHLPSIKWYWLWIKKKNLYCEVKIIHLIFSEVQLSRTPIEVTL